MSRLHSACFVIVVALCFADSLQKPVSNDEMDTLNRVSEKLQPNDAKLNSSGSSASPMVIDQSRRAYYPNANGFGYHNLGQMSMPFSHYPIGLPYQQYQTPMWNNNMQFKDDQHTDARTLGHSRPSLYSQYQTMNAQPHAYAIAAPVTPAYHYQPYEYSTPMVSGVGSHYSGYSGYSPYYRDAVATEEDEPRQFMSMVPSEKYISTVQPSVSYASKYLFEKPTSTFGNIEGISQPQMLQPMSMFLHKDTPVQFQSRDAASGDFHFIPREFTVDDKLQMQISQNYLLEKLQNLPASQMSMIPQHQMRMQPQMSRSAELSQLMPMEHNSQMLLSQPTNFKNVDGLVDTNEQRQDPYISPQDHVYIEPFVIPDSSHAQASRTAGLEMPMTPTWPNYQQQFRIAKIQDHYNAMNYNAAQIENLNQQYVKQRESMLSADKQYFPLGKSSELMSTQENIGRQLQEIKKIAEALVKENELKQQTIEKKMETPKVVKKEDATSTKPADVNGGAVSNTSTKNQ